MNGPWMSARTSGKRKICAVPVVSRKSSGANTRGLGSGNPVRCGLVFKAVVMAGADEGGVISVMPEIWSVFDSVKS